MTNAQLVIISYSTTLALSSSYYVIVMSIRRRMVSASAKEHCVLTVTRPFCEWAMPYSVHMLSGALLGLLVVLLRTLFGFWSNSVRTASPAICAWPQGTGGE